MYCGDETGAFIGDVGSNTSRFGYGGEDCPKVVIPSAVYSRPSSNDDRSRVGNARQSRNFSAPVSLMRAPPNDCFSSSNKGNAEEGSVGFIPIYKSLNSNIQTNAEDGLIQDMDAWAAAWECSYQTLCVRGKRKHTSGHKYYSADLDFKMEGSIDHPLLAVDSTSRTVPTQTQDKQRALMLETLFESLSAPAAYIAPSPMLASFAYGRQTSLVVDIGHLGSRVTPLVDGYCLSSGSVSSGRGGKWLADVQRSVLEGAWNVNGIVVNKWNGRPNGNKETRVPPCKDEFVSPRYLHHPSSNKYPDNKLDVLKRSSFHSMSVHELMYEMMTSSHVLPLEKSVGASAPFDGYDDNSTEVNSNSVIKEKKAEGRDDSGEGSYYMLPDGTRVDLAITKAGKDLCRLPELLFSEPLPSFMQSISYDKHEYPSNMLPLHRLIHKSLTKILDADLRKELCANIILTGGASLFPTLEKRLSTELAELFPFSHKCKVIASKHSVENRYAPWIGGSILSSLGSFQQVDRKSVV